MTLLTAPRPSGIRLPLQTTRTASWDAPEIDTVLNKNGEPLRVLNVHNTHVGPGGFEVFFEGVTEILRDNGHHVGVYERDNATINTLSQKVRALQTAIVSPQARRDMKQRIESDAIDLVHLNNILPLVSPSVIDGCGDAYAGRGVPVVMSMQDYKLTCPAGQHVRDGKVCTRCIGGHEYWAAIHGCRNNRVWSTAYTIRNVVNRYRRTFRDGITLFMPCSNFVRDHLAGAGFDRDQMHVLPDFTDLPEQVDINCQGKALTKYACFVGRISPEKGIPTMIEAARLSGVPLKIAGDARRMPELLKNPPPNVEFVGKLSREQLPDFYRNARFSVVPSEWFECFGIVAAEAQGYGTPVIATAMGGLPEVVVHGETGLIVPPNDPQAMAAAMQALWNDDATVQRMCQAGRKRAKAEFAPSVFYRRIAAAYQHAIDLHREATHA